MYQKKLVLLLLVPAIALGMSARWHQDAYASQSGTTELQQQIDHWFTRLNQESGFSGAVLVAHHDDVVLQKGYGLANASDGSGITAETAFDIGSLSKQFTAAAILYLEQRGLLSVKDPITRYFDNVPSDKANITIHQLLTHTAGFTEDHFEGDLTPMNREEAQQAILSMSLGNQPGSDYHYSNAGYTLLAIMIEKVSGVSYTGYLHHTFFGPLGMKHTGFYNDDWSAGPIANAYFNGKDQGKPSEWAGPFWGVMGNGGVISTVGDLYIWWRSLQNHSVLSSKQTKKLFQRHVSEGSPESFYGYGWSIQDSPYGNIITHNGGGIGGNSDIAFYGDKNLFIVICSNRIVWRTLLSIPLEIRLPATEAREQLADNILNGDFSHLPKSTFMLLPYLMMMSIAAIGLISLAIFLFKRRREQKSKNIVAATEAG